MNNIQFLVQQALQNGFITPLMQVELNQLCEQNTPLSMEKSEALYHLIGALLTGEVVTVPRKQFINVMEELVTKQATACVGVMEASFEHPLDIGDIVAYALNRLPPLYATTEEGAKFQREYAKENLETLVLVQVHEAIANSVVRPEFFPERRTFTKSNFPDPTHNGVLNQVIELLRTCAPNLDEQAGIQQLGVA